MTEKVHEAKACQEDAQRESGQLHAIEPTIEIKNVINVKVHHADGSTTTFGAMAQSGDHQIEVMNNTKDGFFSITHTWVLDGKKRETFHTMSKKECSVTFMIGDEK